MAAEFARKLNGLVDAALLDSWTDTRFALGMIADVISEILETSELDLRAGAVDRRSASEAIGIARAAAEVADACHLIESSLFSSHDERCFQELELPQTRSHDSLSNFLDQNVHGAARESPFVYVVWTRTPECYLYVGRSPNTDRGAQRSRRRFDISGELLAALQQGSLITLMLPSSISATVAGDVKAAILSVLDSQKALPDLNVRSERIPEGLRSAYLAEIGRLLGDLASTLQAPIQVVAG